MLADGVELLFARHGQTAENAGGKILGRRDPPLSAEGREQAAQLAQRAAGAGVVAIWTSPLQRARQTAAAVAEAVEAEPVVLDDLIESDRGSWEGQSLAHLAEASPQLYGAFEVADPGVVSRPALVVAHVGTIRAALLALGRRPPPEREVAHGEVVRLWWPALTG